MESTPVGSEMVSLSSVESSTKKMREERKKASLEMKDFIEKTHDLSPRQVRRPRPRDADAQFHSRVE
jgi:hypothetical protein